MRKIDFYTQDLLKSRKMIGNDKPTHEIKIKGVPLEVEYLWSDDQIRRQIIRGDGKKAGESKTKYTGFGDWVERKDGKILICYQDPNTENGGRSFNWNIYRNAGIRLSVVDNYDTLYYTHNCAEANSWHFKTIPFADPLGNSCKFQRLKDGRILLFIHSLGYNPNGTDTPISEKLDYRCDCYISENGLGTDFKFHGNLYTFDPSLYNRPLEQLAEPEEHAWQDTVISKPKQLPSGRIIIVLTQPIYYHMSGFPYYNLWMVNYPFVCYSDDNGKTWTSKCIRHKFKGGSEWAGLNDDTSWWDIMMSGDPKPRGIGYFDGKLYIHYSLNGWHNYNMIYESSDEGTTWKKVAQEEYNPYQDVPQIYSYLAWGEYDEFTYYIRKLERINGLGSGTAIYRRLADNPIDANKFWDFSTEWELIGYSDLEIDITFNDTHFNIDRSTGFPTISGQHYSRENAQYAVWVPKRQDNPAGRIAAKKISMNRSKDSPAASLTITLDNKNGVLSPNKKGEFEKVLYPGNQVEVKQGYGKSVVKTFTGLIDSVEMTAFPHEITIQCRDMMKKALDQTITKITFRMIPIQSAFYGLAKRIGFKDVKMDITNIRFLGNKTFEWVSYADAFDYLAEIMNYEYYCDENGDLHFKNPTDPGEPAYIFREGEDIISLGYTFDDSEQYRKIIVFGKDSKKKTIKSIYNHPTPEICKLPLQKILKVEINETVSQKKLDKIAERLGTTMVSRLRRVTFAAVAVPWLQIGDTIQVIESSTNISNIYRLLSISSEQDENGYTMELVGYHHSYAPIPPEDPDDPDDPPRRM